jgi:hypothetical protein
LIRGELTPDPDVSFEPDDALPPSFTSYTSQ